jgi:phosphatidylserine/phosphatidylglycerophosphate/cardiolipin synthase-like enzyme
MNSVAAAARYTSAFDELYARFAPDRRQPGASPPRAPADDGDPRLTVGDRRVEVYFPRRSPALHRITELVRSAERSIHFMAFSFTSEELGAAMLERAASGVEVRGVFENSGACNGQYRVLASAEPHAAANIHLLRWIYGPINFMHHKVIVLDAQTVVFASFNFTQSADEANDENVVIVNDSALASQFEEEFQRVESVTALVTQPPRCADNTTPAVAPAPPRAPAAPPGAP